MWVAETDKLLDRMAGRFVRVETRRRAEKFLLGLLADLPRKNCWSIAEHAGESDPHGMQHFLARASWDTDGVRDDLRDYVIGALGDSDGVLVVDETGDLKKGTHTVGVQRQYTGTAGRIENAQVAVYLTYAAAHDHAMIDRELYLPKSWTTDPDRLDEAGVPDGIEFATKPALDTGMLTRAVAAGVPARWVTGDEVYGADPALRAECEYHRIGYVLAIGCDRRIPTAAGLIRADELATDLPRHAWQRLSAGPGAKGERYYDWAWIDHPDPAHPDSETDPCDTRCWSLLIRRHRHTGELAFYRCYSPEPVPLRELVRVAGRRWRSGGILPGRQGPGRARRAPGPALDVLAPLDAARDARARAAGRARRHRAHRPARARRHDRVDLQRDSPPTHPADRQPRPRPGLPSALVTVATQTPTPRPHQPLPAPRGVSATEITIYGWSTR